MILPLFRHSRRACATIRLYLVPPTIGLVLVLALPVTAVAHATLESSDPRADSVVAVAPNVISLSFSEPVDTIGARLRVTAPDGSRYEAGQPTTKGRVLRSQLRPGLPQGTSIVTWSVISDDGHRLSGAFIFSVGAPAPAPTPGDSGITAPPPAPIPGDRIFTAPPGSVTTSAVIRAIRFATIVTAVGIVALLIAVWAPMVRRRREQDPTAVDSADTTFRRSATQLALITLISLVAVALIYVPVEAWRDGLSVGELLSLRQGRVDVAILILALAALPLVALLARRDNRRLAIAAGALVLALAAMPALAGHASAQDPAWPSLLADWAHVTAAGLWGGGLLVLAIAMPAALRAADKNTRESLIADVIQRFTRLALVGLVVLVATGVFSAITLAGSVAAIWETPWGRLLIVKVIVVAVTVLLAPIARRAGDNLSRGVQLEALLVIVAIALTGLLTGLGPRPADITRSATSLALQQQIAAPSYPQTPQIARHQQANRNVLASYLPAVARME